MSKNTKNTESKALITPETIRAENKHLLPELEEMEKKIVAQGESALKAYKDTVTAIAEIESKELYKARGYADVRAYAKGNHLAGYSEASVSQYINVAERFLLSGNPERKALFDKASYTTLAELVTFSDKALVALKEATGKEPENASIDDIRNFKASHEVKTDGKPKQEVIKHYDISGFACQLMEDGKTAPIAKGNTSLSDFYALAGIDPESVHKGAKAENERKIKDSYLYTALSRDWMTVFVFTAILHVAPKKDENHFATTPEARKEALRAYLDTLSPEEKADFLASLAG